VIGAYFVKRVGWKGIVFAGMLALPVLLLGGRGGAEADESAQLRFEAWKAGFDMLLANPVVGVGARMFGEHHEITAHNSYVLSAAETGLPGFVLWSIVVYLSVKIPFTGLRRFSKMPGAEVARDWAMALLAAIGGMLIGIFFLSMTYHYVLWIYMGLCGAYYSAAKTHDPDFKVKFGFVDLMIVIAADLLLLAGLRIYLKLFKGL
jgi:O-antigen ligase